MTNHWKQEYRLMKKDNFPNSRGDVQQNPQLVMNWKHFRNAFPKRGHFTACNRLVGHASAWPTPECKDSPLKSCPFSPLILSSPLSVAPLTLPIHLRLWLAPSRNSPRCWWLLPGRPSHRENGRQFGGGSHWMCHPSGSTFKHGSNRYVSGFVKWWENQKFGRREIWTWIYQTLQL